MKQDAENNIVTLYGAADSKLAQSTTLDSDGLLIIPSTESQREIWTSAKHGLDANLAFNESVSLRFKGELDIHSLQNALAKLVERHESLRATFSIDGTKFCVAKVLGIEVPVVDLTTASQKESEIQLLLSSEVKTPFDLEQGPLFRAQIIKIGICDHLLILTAHHIICDGWSYAVILKDLACLYMAEQLNSPDQLTTANSFSEYAQLLEDQMKTPEYQKDKSYWLDKFQCLPSNLDLPTDRSRPPLKTYNSQREDYTLDEELVTSIKKTGAKLGCSFVQTLLAGFEVLLHRLSGQDNFVVGFLAAGQASMNQLNLVGHCVNNLPLRISIKSDLKFDSFLKYVKSNMLDAYEHQQFTYGSLVKELKMPRDASRLPLCSIIFNVDQTLDSNKLGFKDLDVQFASNPRSYENFELFVNAVDQGGSILLEVQYNSDLFDATTIRYYMSCFETLLRGIVCNPSQEISHLPLLSILEQEKLIVQWNETQASYPHDVKLHGLFEQQVIKTPDRIAVEFEWENGLSYRILDERSNQLALHLRSKGVRPGKLVGLFIDRSVEMLIATLAVLKAGGAYVPLDPDFPKERIEYMITDSKLSVIISQSWLTHTLPEHQVSLVVLDIESKVISALSTASLDTQLPPESPAFVIYTSGSTGKPKGVLVPHQSIVNLLLSVSKKPGISSADILVAVTTLSFDIAVVELYLPIISGAKTIIASRESVLDGKKLLKLLKQSGATFLQATPATWRMLILSGWDKNSFNVSHFKAISTGEALQRDLSDQLLDRVDSLWNLYGPTETTVFSTCTQIVDPTLSIHIGKPIDNTQLYILDAWLQPVPVGVEGELYIGGTGVTLGYVNRIDLTAERFIDNPYFNPFAENLSPKLYKTGDLARYLPDGNVKYLGRNDNQVKVRGYRIELEEIETVLGKYTPVQQCAVMIRKDNPDDVRIVAYAILKPDTSLTFEETLNYLRQFLPAYMLPQHLMIMESFPRTQNGKVERKSLPEPTELSVGHDREDFKAPQTETELQIARIWKDILKIESISKDDNFFNLGGHSLLSMQFITRLENETGFRLNPRFVIINTLAQLARQVPSASTINETTEPSHSEGVVGGLFNWVRKSFNKTESAETKPTNQKVLKARTSSKPAPASLKQERVWDLTQINPDQTTYNLPAAFRLNGILNFQALQKSLNELMQRHAILRTNLVKNKNGVLEQSVSPKLEINLTPMDLSEFPSETRENKLLEELTNEAAKPFELTKDPLIRAKLYILNPQESVFFLMPHQAIWDGWSFDIFLGEMALLYQANSQNKSNPLAPLTLQYSDFAQWQRELLDNGQFIKEQEYWLKKLSGNLPVLSLPQQKSLRGKASFVGAMHEVAFPITLVNSITAMGHNEKVTLSVVLLAAYKTLLHSYSNQNDILVGLPVLGREPAVESIIGYFVNMLPIRSYITHEDMSFRDLMVQVQENTFEAYEHQEIPFEQLSNELIKAGYDKNNSFIQTMFSFQDASQRATRFGDLELVQMPLHSRGSPFEFSLWFKSNIQGLVGAIEYRTDMFDASTIEAMASDFGLILETIKLNPNISLRELKQLIHLKDQVTIPTKSVLNKPTEITNLKQKNPFYFNNGDKQIFALFQPARSQALHDTAVLLCYPIGQEYIRSHWAVQQLGNQLTMKGFPILRFDYYATGDSQGECIEGTVTQWKSDVVAAANKLRELSGMKNVSIVGLRFGATLATLAAQDGLEVQNLILWDPVLNGSDYINELKTLHNMQLTSSTNGKTNSKSNNMEEMMGFPWPNTLQQQINSIDLIHSGIFTEHKILVIYTSDNEHLTQFKDINPELTIHNVSEAGDWNKITDAYNRLICPSVNQTIINRLTGDFK